MDNYLLVSTNGQATEIVGETKIGRSKTNDLVLVDPLASRHHATIYFEGDVIMIRDEQSVNGTIVNGSQIYEATVLEDRDTVQFGDEVFNLRAPLAESKTVKAADADRAGLAGQGEQGIKTVKPDASQSDGELLGSGTEDVSEGDNRRLIIIGGAAILILCVCSIIGFIVLNNLNLY